MTPLTRKENYLNEIVGWGNTAPEKPLTHEELFFAAILGEAVQVPEPLTRYQMYLAKIAGCDIEISTPITRLEYFLAKAAGMDVVTPVPLTKEEIFWANYKGIEQIIEGIPPLTFKSNGANLSNYRIYGNTVNGESVGDRTGNLAPNLGRWIDGYLKQSDGTLVNATPAKEKTSPFIEVNSNDEFTFSYDIGSNKKWAAVTFYDENKNFIYRSVQYTVMPFTFIVNIENAKFIRLSCNTFGSEIYPNLNSGSTALPYEPYGYRVPVTVNSNTTNIYLDEQLVKSGDDADYIDYDTQKRYNADGTTVDVELPTLQTVEGTNTLSVGTTVQPSKVYIKGQKERD